MTKGPLAVAVCTGGAAPKLAAKIRSELEATIPDEYAVMLDELRTLRPAIKRLGAESRERFWQTVSSLDVTSYHGQADVLRQRIRTGLEQFAATTGQRIAESGG
jgi:siroheme synthase (precorrin-2 oxidase/ferrochelatase)